MTSLSAFLEESKSELITQFPYQFKISIRREKGEKFSIQRHGNEFHVEAANQRSAIYAIHHLITGLKSSYLAEFLGEYAPRLHRRILKIEGQVEVGCGNQLSMHLPDLSIDQWHFLCQRLLALGYNALMLGSSTSPIKANLDLKQIFDLIKSYEIECIPQFSFPVTSPINQAFKKITSELKDVVKKFPQIDQVFWQGCAQEFLSDPKTRDFTAVDLLELEIKTLEKQLSKGLIYYVASNSDDKQSSQWLIQLANLVGKHTSLAFSAVAGSPYEDHALPHSLWDALRRLPQSPMTPLLPILNSGGVRQGECLWPSCNSDLFDQYIQRCFRNPFNGIISITRKAPKKGSLLEAALWVASQSMWQNKAAYLLYEEWFSAHRPELEYAKHLDILKKAREVTLLISSMRSYNGDNHEAKSIAELALAKIKYIESYLIKYSNKKFNLRDYFLPFIADARRLLNGFVQQYQLSIPSFKKEEDEATGFWTGSVNGQIQFFDDPNPGKENQIESRIFKLETHITQRSR